jgi:hypothetical protein
MRWFWMMGNTALKPVARKQHGAKALLRTHCMPTLVEDILAIRSAKATGDDVGSHPYWKAVGKLAARTATSAAVQFTSTSLIGSLSWQTKVGAPSTNSLDNASPLASTIAMSVASIVPLAYHELAANISLGIDMALSVVRIGVEQAVWRQFKITPDFPGTVVSPVVIGAAEVIYKTVALADTPPDPTTRLMQGIKGVYGNLVRLAMAGVIVVGGLIAAKIAHADNKAPA